MEGQLSYCNFSVFVAAAGSRQPATTRKLWQSRPEHDSINPWSTQFFLDFLFQIFLQQVKLLVPYRTVNPNIQLPVTQLFGHTMLRNIITDDIFPLRPQLPHMSALGELTAGEDLMDDAVN